MRPEHIVGINLFEYIWLAVQRRAYQFWEYYIGIINDYRVLQCCIRSEINAYRHIILNNPASFSRNFKGYQNRVECASKPV